MSRALDRFFDALATRHRTPPPTARQVRGLLEAIDVETSTGDSSLYRARLATIVYAPGRGNAERTTSRRRRAGSRRTKRLARRGGGR